MNEKASKPPAKKRSRRDRRQAGGGDMEALLNQMSGGGMDQLMKTMAGGGGLEQLMAGMGNNGGDMAELMKNLGNLGDLDLGSMMQEGMGMWKTMLDSPEMQAMLNDPDQMREMMMPFVEMMGGDKSKLEEVRYYLPPTSTSTPATLRAQGAHLAALGSMPPASSPHSCSQVLADPALLKQSMNQGLETMTDLFSDPEKMTEMASSLMDSLDPGTKDKVSRLAAGDEEVLQEMLAEVIARSFTLLPKLRHN